MLQLRMTRGPPKARARKPIKRRRDVANETEDVEKTRNPILIFNPRSHLTEPFK